ncbi:restriction endonuclease [Acinetobacter baumannii]|uniref:AbaSI family restriction endonuclease n=1 Tax=Acinetobacter baumannii TaxID=470 RepID=UPI001CB80070|nr:restriction endonuclease [Acinetobacter baumannii]MBZ0372140.1 restriction endonuclease [Acinetobacter baumannii]MCZ3201615.1 restriction endonuclease [Acinetobacter baumannii]HEE6635029.1 restriction endonuclease [Acinetobacter baumannii]
MFSSDLTDYVIRQLGRTKNKRYEAYVVSRIIHLLNDFTLKFVTQQFVRLSNKKIALTDLYFPQLGIHIEVDEGHHFLRNSKMEYSLNQIDEPLYSISQTESDAMREEDIISITGHKIFRVNVYKNQEGQPQNLESIHQQIDKIIEEIKTAKNKLIEASTFKEWNIETEYNPQTYINLGRISLADNVVLKTTKDVCNCFGYNYKNYQRGGAIHPYEEDTLIWFPRLYENKDWINTISPDGLTITEKSTDEAITLKKLEEWKNGPQKRIVFARVKDNLSSRAMYRFMGLYEFQKADLKDGAVWKRVECEVQTYSPKETKC